MFAGYIFPCSCYELGDQYLINKTKIDFVNSSVFISLQSFIIRSLSDYSETIITADIVLLPPLLLPILICIKWCNKSKSDLEWQWFMMVKRKVNEFDVYSESSKTEVVLAKVEIKKKKWRINFFQNSPLHI